MTQDEINNYFTKFHPKLKKDIGIFLIKYKKDYDADMVITETYLHLIKNKHLIKSKKDIEAISFKFVSQNIYWYNSQINKMNLTISNTLNKKNVKKADKEQDEHVESHLIELNEPLEVYENKIYNIIDDENELDYKIELEKNLNTNRAILSLYREQLTDNVMIVIFDTVVSNNVCKCSYLVNYLNISRSTSCIYYKRLKEEINEFVNNYNK